MNAKRRHRRRRMAQGKAYKVWYYDADTGQSTCASIVDGKTVAKRESYVICAPGAFLVLADVHPVYGYRGRRSWNAKGEFSSGAWPNCPLDAVEVLP